VDGEEDSLTFSWVASCSQWKRAQQRKRNWLVFSISALLGWKKKAM